MNAYELLQALQQETIADLKSMEVRVIVYTPDGGKHAKATRTSGTPLSGLFNVVGEQPRA